MRVWLLDPGLRPRVLHLAASAGRPRADRRAEWNRTDGSFRSFRMGTGKVGITAAQAAPVTVRDLQRAKGRMSLRALGAERRERSRT